MPKRSNPFVDHFSPQLKTYVRDREVNNGISQPLRMKPVYDRTRQLLFEGMKGVHKTPVMLDTNENLISFAPTRISVGKSECKQMYFGKNCELITGGETLAVDMETDSNSNQGVCDLPLEIAAIASYGNKRTEIVGANSSSADCSFPHSFTSSTSCWQPSSSHHQHVCGTSQSSMAGNAFVQLKQAQLKKTVAKETDFSLKGSPCPHCRQPVALVDILRCQFCEKNVCSSCVRQCSECLLRFCQLCSVINYDQRVERCFCLNCHGS